MPRSHSKDGEGQWAVGPVGLVRRVGHFCTFRDGSDVRHKMVSLHQKTSGCPVAAFSDPFAISWLSAFPTGAKGKATGAPIVFFPRVPVAWDLLRFFVRRAAARTPFNTLPRKPLCRHPPLFPLSGHFKTGMRATALGTCFAEFVRVQQTGGHL